MTGKWEKPARIHTITAVSVFNLHCVSLRSSVQSCHMLQTIETQITCFATVLKHLNGLKYWLLHKGFIFHIYTLESIYLFGEF